MYSSCRFPKCWLPGCEKHKYTTTLTPIQIQATQQTIHFAFDIRGLCIDSCCYATLHPVTEDLDGLGVFGFELRSVLRKPSGTCWVKP